MSDAVKRDGLGRIHSQATTGVGKFGIILLFVKIVRCIGIFESYDLLKSLFVIQFVFIVKLISAGVFLLLQKPFSSGQKLTKRQWSYVVRHAVLGTVTNLLWIFCLTLCGPVRTILVFEHGEPILVSMFVGFFANGHKGNYARARGTLMFFLGIVCLLLFDNDSPVVNTTAHPEGEHVSVISHWISSIISYFSVTDHKGGIVLLVVTLLFKVARNGYSKRVGALVGGVKRLNALSTFFSSLILFPFVLIISFSGSSELSIISNFFPLVFVTFSVFVVDYYGQSMLSNKLDPVQVSRLGYFFISVTALFVGFQWSHPAAVAISKMHGSKIRTEEHVISGGVIISTIFLCLSTDILSWPSPKSHKGSFIGYSSEGAPLYRFAGDVLNRASKTSLGALAQGFLARVLEEKDSRHIFYFLCINLSFAFVELFWGLWSNSLGLVSDSFHMLFDCTALVLGLIAAVIAKWKPSRIFPYGYGRIEVLSGFVNGLFLLVVALFLIVEAIERLMNPPRINTDKLLAVSVMGLMVNLVGVFVFGHQHHHHHDHEHDSHSHKGHDHNHDHNHHHHHHGGNSNLKGIYLHVLADLLGSVGVIISSFIIDRWNLLIADPICTILVAALILSTVWPLLRDSAKILTLSVPPNVEITLRKAIATVTNIDGVISMRYFRAWQHTENEIVVVITVHVESHVIEQRIVSQVATVFRNAGVSSVTVQVEKDDFYQHMSGLVTGADDSYHHILNGISSKHSSDSEQEFAKLI